MAGERLEVDDTVRWRLASKELQFCYRALGNRHPRTGEPTMWEFSRYLVDALMKYKRVAVTSSRSTSKTYTLGQLVPAFLYTEPSRCIVIAPSMRQVELGVMGEARAAMGRSVEKLPTASGTTTRHEIKIDERHWAIGLPARDPDSMRGFHASPRIPGNPDQANLTEEDLEWLKEQATDDASRMLIIIDEATGISQESFQVLRGMLTKPNVYLIMTGNPMMGADEEHEYVKAFREGSSFHRIRVSSVDPEEYPVPSGLEYDVTFHPVPEYLVSPEEIANALTEYPDPKSEPVFLSDWAGVFSSGSTEFNVVPRTALEAALATREANLRPLGPRIGIDIGTGNPDMCVASLFVDGVKRTEYAWAPERDDREGQVSIANVILALATKWGAEIEGVGPGGSEWDGSPIPGSRISIDDSGLVGVCDILGSRGCLTDRVNFARGASGMWRDIVGTQRFNNVRTEMHWIARRGLQEGVFVIPRTFRASWQQATWTMYKRDFDGKGPIIKLEPKEQVKKRHGGKSPDTFDADILAMRAPDTSGLFSQQGPRVVSPHSGQPIRNGRLRPTKLKGGRRIG